MNRFLTILTLLFVAFVAAAQERPAASSQDAATDSPMQSLNDWMQDNLDQDLLNALNDIDQEKVRKVLTSLQKGFDGTNVVDLAAIKDAASEVTPLLKQYEETYPFGVWLESRLDYFDAAGRIQRQMKLIPPKEGPTALPLAPTLKLERQVWVDELKQRPWPPLAQNYVPKLKEIFVAERMPPELVWLAEVESSFNPQARSPAGAAGMFQLMPITAKGQNLSLWPFDERYQPEKSARASARYLRHLHAHYGDWQLALAAYNAGEARVDKLLKQSKVKSFDAIARRLPAETQMYVPKIEATLRKREGLTFAELKRPKPQG
ncbi:lytic transglycosylase domain-containing protein [Pedosphaera parvula]|uniref:Lytic transglycosylase catalytic n=1 Tax=Pedosphaera parvula (strain Ellin514) TaxID=320771 RepID=B9XCK3_PEDPL|nr:lytic transglycosylase domain-containing protein [Pedosphaera parvula]EEF62671.1 Lytic transglycosylase catalytic [Pedosphaera parvula Ellin514]